MKKLHIYGQKAHHDDVDIVGDLEALEELKNTIVKAIEKHKLSDGKLKIVEEKTHHLFCTDGEGYNIVITLVDGGSPIWDRLAETYTIDYARERREDAIWPWNIKPNEEPKTNN